MGENSRNLVTLLEKNKANQTVEDKRMENLDFIFPLRSGKNS
jgi:hypothetical protein